MGSRGAGARGRAGAGVAIRRAVARDAKRISRMVRGSGAYEGLYASAVDGYRVGPDYVEAHRVFVAVDDERDGRLLGFYSLVVDPPELDLMFVADQEQGAGIGRLLMEHMREEARRAGLARVRVVSHPPAAGFYRSMGARPGGTEPANPPGVRWERPVFVIDVAEE